MSLLQNFPVERFSPENGFFLMVGVDMEPSLRYEEGVLATRCRKPDHCHWVSLNRMPACGSKENFRLSPSGGLEQVHPRKGVDSFVKSGRCEIQVRVCVCLFGLKSPRVSPIQSCRVNVFGLPNETIGCADCNPTDVSRM